MGKLPLEGVRVVDICVVWAGPVGAWLLAALGAEVIHIDNPYHVPDYGRDFQLWVPPASVFAPMGGGPPAVPFKRPWNAAPAQNRYLWNRKSVSINLSSAEGRDVFLRLIKESDIFMENNSATAMEHLGLGPEVVREANPQIICIDFPAWGRSGPYKGYVGWGALHEAIVGHTWIRGYDDDDHPLHSTMRFKMDSAGGPTTALIAMMALAYRRRTGKGIWVDFAQIQTVPNHLGEIFMDCAWNDRDHRTMGNRHPTAVQGCYRCRGPEPTLQTSMLGGERWVNITISNDEEWAGFCKALGNPEWTKDPKFADPISRRQNHDELDKHIESWTKKRDNFEAFHILQQHGVPAGPVEDWRDTYNDQQLNARDFFITTGNEETGLHRQPGFPWKLSETPLEVFAPPAMLSEHTEQICKDVIGMSDEEYAQLIEKKVIGMDYYPTVGPRPDYEGWAQERGIDI